MTTHFSLRDTRSTTVLERVKRDRIIQRFLKHGTWGSNLNCVIGYKPVNKATKECKIINTWKEEEGTVTTFVDSLDGTSSLESSTGSEFSVVVKGTRYTGIKRATNNSFGIEEGSSSGELDVEGETMKDRNRRLLAQEREETIDGARSQEMVRMLKKRTIKCRHGTRVKSRTKTKKNRSLGKVTSVVGQNFLQLSVAFSEIIRLYSSLAFRYALFRSNRRYKPGD